jgi:hypothetical protein
MNDRATRSCRRRASRARWSSSTLGTLFIGKLCLNIALSRQKTLPAKIQGAAAQLVAVNRLKTRDASHIARWFEI